jgi:phage terminase large subunit
MPLSKGQSAITKSTARFKVVVSGRRFGKTYLAMRELAKQARLPNKTTFYVAPTYRQAKQTVWKPLKAKLNKLNWIEKVNESDLSITLVNGSVIGLRGADKFDSLRGIGLDYLVMDEFSYTKMEAWTEVLRPTLSDTNGSAMFITTPAGQGNWSFDMYQKGQQEDDKEWASWQFTTLEGGRVSEDEIEQARRDLDDRTFRQEYEASFETYSGQIYYNFSTNRHVTEYTGNFEACTTIYIGCDFNVNPISAGIAVKTMNGLHLIDEVIIYSSNTDELVQEIKTRYPKKKVVIYPDPSGVQRRTSANGRTDVSILQNAGFTVKHRHKHPAVRDRINSVNSMLLTSDGTVKVKVSPKCKHIINGLSKQVFKEGTQIPDKSSGFDHTNDAIGYMIEYLFPIRKDVPEFDESATFGMATF